VTLDNFKEVLLMKKTFFVLLAIALVGMAAFADDAAPAAPAASAAPTAKFNLNIMTGAYLNGDHGTIIAGDSDNLSDSLSRIDFKGDISSGDVGAKFTIRQQSISSDMSSNPFKARRAFAYYNFLDGKAQFQVGRVGNGDFATSWYGSTPFDNGDLGALITVSPISNLSLGYLYCYSSDTASKIDDQFKHDSVFAANYAVPDLLTAMVGFRDFWSSNIAIVADVNVTAIKDLALSAELEYNDGCNAGNGSLDYEEVGTSHIIEHAAYTVGKITPSIVAYEVLIADKDKAAPYYWDNSYYFQPAVAYAFSDKITLGAEFKYGNIETDSGTCPVQAADASKAYSTIDAYAKIDFGKGYIKVKPGYDGCDDHDFGGFFVRAVFDATL
jgi:hypothetical protein